jgi:hypothetical protein
VFINQGAFSGHSPENRAFRSNLFGLKAKKYFRFNPLRKKLRIFPNFSISLKRHAGPPHIYTEE